MTPERRALSWAEYPHNIESNNGNSNGHDFGSYYEQLKREVERLFEPGDRLSIRIIEVGAREVNLKSLKELEDYLTESKRHNVTRVFLIPQQSSWGRLVINYEAICKLLSYLNVHPILIDVLCAFGVRTAADNESYTIFRSQRYNGLDNEISYLIKHAEMNGREGASNPWSIRQMGVWHGKPTDSRDSFIIINACKSLQRLLRTLQNHDESSDVATVIHSMILASAMSQWKWYIEYLERQYTSMKTKSQLASVLEGEERLSPWTDIHFDDIQDIQVLQDQFLQTRYHLDTSTVILEKLTVSFSALDDTTDRTVLPISSLTDEAQLQALRVTSILQRVDATLALVRAILDFRSLANLQSSSKNMAELTRLSRDDNELMVDLSQKAAKDADVLKTVTLLGLIYLPAAFVASLMSMGYITVHTDPHFSIRFSGEFWIFLVLTALFLLLTLGSYYVWMQSKYRSARSRARTLCDGLKEPILPRTNGYQNIQN